MHPACVLHAEWQRPLRELRWWKSLGPGLLGPSLGSRNCFWCPGRWRFSYYKHRRRMHVCRVCERIHAGCDGAGVPGSTRRCTTRGNPGRPSSLVELRWDTRSPSRSCESLSRALLGHQGLCGAPRSVFPRGRDGVGGSGEKPGVPTVLLCNHEASGGGAAPSNHGFAVCPGGEL